MATYRGFCESWGILLGWNTSGCCIGIPSTFEREGPLDWNIDWFYCTSNIACSGNSLHKLAKTGAIYSLLFQTFPGLFVKM